MIAEGAARVRVRPTPHPCPSCDADVKHETPAGFRVTINTEHGPRHWPQRIMIQQNIR